MRFKANLVVLLLAPLLAAAQEPVQYELKRDAATTGSRLRSTGATSTLPFDKPYGELTPIEQARLKAEYESMGPEDEPPYPVAGTKRIWKSLVDAGDRFREYGPLTIVVDVDAEGKATQATVLKTPGKRLGTYMSKVLLEQRYKGAVCAGTPCAQQFKFAAEWVEE